MPVEEFAPNECDAPVGTAADAALFRAIMERRFAERSDAVASNGLSRTVVVIGASDGVRLHNMGDNYQLFVYLNPGAPACALKLINGALWFDSEEGELTWQELMAKAAGLPVTLPRNSPYLHVLDDEVQGIVFVGDGGWMTDDAGVPYGDGQQDVALYCLILDGARRPDFLSYDGDVDAFVAGLWQAVDCRDLCPAGNRLQMLADHLVYEVEGPVASIKYTRTDGARPSIAVRRPYVLWGAVDRVPGENTPESGPYSNTLVRVLTGRR